MKTFYQYTKFMLIVCFLGAFLVTNAQDLVKNGSFEIGVLTDWSKSGGSTVSSTNPKCHTKAAYLPPSSSISQNMDVNPTCTYEVSYWGKRINTSTWADLTIKFYDCNNVEINKPVHEWVQSTNWTHYTFTLTAPANACDLRFWFGTGSSASAYLDCVEIVQVCGPECEAYAEADFKETCENDPITFNVGDNDIIQPDAFNIKYSIVSPIEPSKGTATLANNGSLTYTPANNFSGTAFLNYELCYDLPGHTSNVNGAGTEIFNDCGDNKIIDVYAKGLENGGTTLSIPNCANVTQMVVEVLIKGCNKVYPSSITIEGVNAPGEDIYAHPGGWLANEKLYRATIYTCDGTINISSPANCFTSIAAYVERDQPGGSSALVISNKETYYGWGNPAQICTNLPIGTAAVARDIDLAIPIHDKSSDGRVVEIWGNGCGETDWVSINTANAGAGAALANLTLTNVPAGCSVIQICGTSPQGNGDSFIIGAVSVSTDECSPTSGTCCDAATVSLEVFDAPNANAGPDVTICSGATVTLTAGASGGSPGYTYKWNNGLGSGISKNVTPTATTNYTVTVTDAEGCTDTDVVKVTVVTNYTNPGTIAANETKCSGYDPANITSSAGPSGGSGGSVIYVWQKREYNCGTGAYGSYANINGATSATYNPPAITTTTQYRRLARRSHCFTWVYSAPVTKTVVDNYTNGGVIAGNEVKCAGYNPANITSTSAPSGGCGGSLSSIWQMRKLNCSTGVYTSWATISGATALTYNPVAITQTTQYRRLSRRVSGCTPGWAYSNIVTKEVVDNFTDGGTIGSNQTKCAGFDPANITSIADPSGGCGGTPLYYWQARTYDCDNNTYSAWAQVGGNSLTYNPGPITVTTHYRRLAYRVAGCDPYWAISNTVVKEVVGNYTNGGTIAADETKCAGFDPALITSTTDPSGGCGGTSDIRWYKWEYNCAAGTWSSGSLIAGASSMTYNPGPITVTTRYRRYARRGNDCTGTTGSWVVSNYVIKEVVDQYTDGGTIAGDQELCGSYDPSNITSSANPSGGCGGTEYSLWQKREKDCTSGNYGSWSTISGVTGVTYNPGTITTTTQFRRLSRRTSGCAPGWAYSNVITKTVVENFANPGSIAADQASCGAFDPAMITGNVPGGGCEGTIEYRWQMKVGAGAWTNIASSNSMNYDPTTVTETTSFRRQARRLPCTQRKTSVPVVMTVNSDPIVSATNDGPITCLKPTVTLTANPAGQTYLWSTNATSRTIQVTTGGVYTVEITDANGCKATATTTVIEDNDPPVANAGSDVAICEATCVDLTATGAGTYKWSTNETTAMITVCPTDPTTAYTVTVTGANGCTDSDAVVVSINDNPNAGIVGPLTTCAIEDAQFQVINPQPGQYFAWDFDGGTTLDGDTNDASETVQWPVTAANTSRTVVLQVCSTNANGPDCCETYTHTITITNEVFANAGPDQEICQGGSTQLGASPSGQAGSTYVWTPNIFLNNNGAANPLANPPTTITYTLTTTLNGCVRSDQVTVIVDVNKNPIADAGPAKEGCLGSQVQLGGNPTGTRPPAEPNTTIIGYVWSPTAGLSDPNSANPTLTISGTQTYEVVVIASTGCTDTSYVDVTMINCGTISGQVSEDIDNNDTGDDGIVGVTINLVDKTTGAIVATTTTSNGFTDVDGDMVIDPAGSYFFGDLFPGIYTVIEGQPNGYVDVYDRDDSDDGDPNDLTDPTNNEIPVTLAPGEDDKNNNFVEEQLGTIAGNVSEDINNDDNGDTNLAGIAISLVDKTTGLVVANTTTNAQGNYLFIDLPPSTYTVLEDDSSLPGTYTDVKDGDESNDGDPTDGIFNQDDEITVVLTPGEDDTENDFVEEQLGKIRGNVSEDIDNDDIGDANLQGILVTLIDKSDGSVVATKTTNINGNYVFTNLPPGNYTVVEDDSSLAATYTDVQDGDESDDGDATDLVFDMDDEISVTLTPGEDDKNNDFIEEQLGVISGDVTEDLDNDDIGDANLPGISITLIDKSDGSIVATTTTGTDGSYSFTGVPPGNYTVVENDSSLPDTYNDVQDGDESDDGDATDLVFNTDDEISVTLLPGETDDENDFIEEQLGSIAGNVSEDTDNDDMGEVNLAGIAITLVDKVTGATVANTTTDGSGDYVFPDLPPSTYTVIEDDSSLAATYSDVQDGDESNDGDPTDGVFNQDDEITVVLTPGEDDTENDFIEEQLGTIGGSVTEDTDNDDNGDTPLAGIPVSLVDKTTGLVVANTTTDGNGNYSFPGIPAGSYTVLEDDSSLPGTYVNVDDGDDSNDGDATDGTFDQDDAIPVTLTPGEDDLDNNFTEEQLGKISGNVSEDTDNDDMGEVNLAGISVTLIDKATGAVVATKTTNANGNYVFTNLPAGEYTVVEDDSSLAATYTDVQDGDESDDGDANDLVFNMDEEISVTLTPGEHDRNNDFIEEQLGSISGTVTEDTDNDDNGDAPLAGIPVSLVDKSTGLVIANTTTDGNGAYSFPGIPAGSYTVLEDDSSLPGTYTNVDDGDDSNDGDATDGTFDQDDAIPVILTPGEDDTDNNFTEEQLGTIGGSVTEDTDNDDNGDVPLAGIPVSLVDKTTGLVVANTTTDGNGNYSFPGIPAGSYTVLEDDSSLPGTYTNVDDGDDSNDGDATDGTFDQDDAIPVTLTPGEDDLDNNFTEEQLGTVSGSVTEDTDADGNGDVPLAGIPVSLVDKSTGLVVANTTTDGNGNYSFPGIPAGTYTVLEDDSSLPGTYANVDDGDDSNDGDATDGTFDQDDAIPVVLTPGETDSDNNFTEEQLGSISGTVTEDTDNDDDGDIPLSGIPVSLVDKNTGLVVANTTTNGSGAYSFPGLQAGSYTVLEDDSSLPGTYANVDDGDDSNDGDATDGTFDQDDAIPVILTPGEDDTDNNFTEEQLGVISGSATEDTDGDGNGDAPLSGIPISLVDKNTGLVVANTTTDGNGNYSFPGIPAGTYTILEDDSSLPGTYADVDDGDDSNDGDATDGTFDQDDAIPVVLTPGETDSDNNFTEEQLGSISGTVTEDTDNDDDGDVPLSGIAVSLVDKNTGLVVANTTTNGSGAYSFPGLSAGPYTVLEDDTSLPGTYVNVDDGDDSNDGDATDGTFNQDDAISVVLTPGEDDTDNNFTEEQLGVISGSATEDTDGDGNGDAPLSGIPISLVDKNTGLVVANTTTDGNGNYSFPGIPAGTYTVLEDDSSLPGTYADVDDGDDSNDGDATDGTFDQDDAIPVVLTPGETDSDNNFTEEQLGSISGTVTEDTDNDDDGDIPLSGIPISLVDKNTGLVVANTTTNGSGAYSFPGLSAGPYTVLEDDSSLPGTYVNVDDGDDSNDGDATDGTFDQDDAISVMLTAGENDTDNNFTEEQLGVVGGSVTEDTDNDDDGDIPLVGIPVSLVDKSTGLVVANTTTDGNGNYSFPGIPAGTYTVLEDDSSLVGTHADVDDGDDSNDGDATDGTFDQDDAIPVILTPGESDLDNNFTEEQYATLGDKVWFDMGNGAFDQYDPGVDPGVQGIVVNLLDVAGNPVLDSNGNPITDITDTNGDYLFTNLLPGSYRVEFEIPTIYTLVNPNASGNDTNDSDAIDQGNGTGRTGVYVLAGGDDNRTADAGLKLTVVDVELVDFYGSHNDARNVNALTWITETEINNKEFVIERAFGQGNEFTAIGKREGNGTSAAIHTYTFDDKDVAKNGTYFYRLRQIDTDGSETMSNTIAIRIERTRDTAVKVFPNPASNNVTLNVVTGQDSELNLSIFDTRGRTIAPNFVEQTLSNGSTDIELDITELVQGTYILRIEVGTETFVKRLSVVK